MRGITVQASCGGGSQDLRCWRRHSESCLEQPRRARRCRSKIGAATSAGSSSWKAKGRAVKLEDQERRKSPFDGPQKGSRSVSCLRVELATVQVVKFDQMEMSVSRQGKSGRRRRPSNGISEGGMYIWRGTKGHRHRQQEPGMSL